jgi:putative flippase GtrA
MIMVNSRERVRFFRFAIVGSIGAVVDFGILNLLTIVFSVPAVYSSIVSFIAAVASNFTWNRHWTYPDSRSKPVSKQLVQFVVVSVIGLGIRTPLFAFLERELTRVFAQWSLFRAVNPGFVAHNVALAVVILVVMMWNFIANRYWTYSDIS